MSFVAWLDQVKAAGHEFKSEREREAFYTGSLVGLRSYKTYQITKPTSC
jgi:hypothetical protein